MKTQGKAKAGRYEKFIDGNYIPILAGSVILYGICSFIFAHPYRMFPSDDIWYYEILQWPVFESTDIYNPVLHQFLRIIAFPFKLMKTLTPDILLYQTVLSNMITIVIIFLFIRMLTENILFPFLGILVFTASSWTNTYYFFYSYAPFTTSLAALTYYLLAESIPADPGKKPVRAYVMPAVAGITAGLCLFSSVSSIVMISLSFFFLPLMFVNGSDKIRPILKVLVFFACLIIIVLLFSQNSFIAYISHIKGNLATYHYASAYNKFQFVPSIGSFAFIKTLFVYSPPYAILLPVIIALSFINLAIRLVDYIRKKTDTLFSSLKEKINYLLLLILLLQICIVELSPATKLGRTFFTCFPIIIIFSLSFFRNFMTHLKQTATLKAIAGKLPVLVFSGLLLVISVHGIIKSAEIYHSRTDLPNRLARYYRNSTIYVLDTDPHSKFLRRWLDDFRISVINKDFLNRLLIRENEYSPGSILLLGPQGKNSGNSVLELACLGDFLYTLPEGHRYNTEYVRYYAYQPEFMMEEEICQGVLFNKMAPPASVNDYGIKIISW